MKEGSVTVRIGVHMRLSRGTYIVRILLPVPVAVLLCLGATRMPLCAQQSSPPVQTKPSARPPAQPAPRVQSQGPAVPQGFDPTRPEAQPDLSLDHDPILSPDPEDNMAINPAAPAPTEQAGALKKGQNGVYTLHEDVDEVLLNCTVIDENGKPVMDLKQSDFRIWEDGVPQTTNSFQHQDLPVSVGLIIDNSGSMRDKRTAVNGAALTLLRDSNPKDTAFVVNFSDRAFLDQGFTSDISLLNRGLSHFDSQGTTAMYDAVAASADELSKHAKQPKQALLIITDGADNASRLSLEESIRRVQNLGGPVVYTIGLLFDNEQAEAQRARSALDMLSEETGGIAYFPRSLDEVDKIARDVATDIRNQYVVGYHSTKPSSIEGYRTIHVEARTPRHGRLIVRTRKGYIARRAPGQPTQTAQQTRQ
jgi:Ca-activated chloride channel homolog